MELICGNDQINIRTGELSSTLRVERAYLKQFNGATVKYVSNEEGDKLVISVSG